MTDDNSVNEDQLRENIKNYSSEKLAEMVASHRYLGLFREACIVAMEELSRRRESGDPFPYEKHIADHLESLPKINTSLPKMDLPGLLKLLKGKR